MVTFLLLGFLYLGTQPVESAVYANFTIHYDYVSSDEIVILQYAIEEVGMIVNMSVTKIRMVSPDVMSVPQDVKVQAISSTKIFVSWKKRMERIRNYTIQGYTVFCRLFPDGPWERFSTGFVTNHTIINRKAYTLYTIRVVAYHSGGNGISSEFFDVKTLGGTPSIAPEGLSCFSETSTKIVLNWDMLSDELWNGKQVGYFVQYQLFNNDSSLRNMVVASRDTAVILEDLNEFTTYKIFIAAATVKGSGPRSGCALSTLEGVPSKAPEIIHAALDPQRPLEAFIEWKKIPEEYQNGNLAGYKIFYGVTRDGKTKIEYPNEIEIDVDKHTTAITLKNLQIDTEIRISIAGKTSVGDGVRSQPEFIETCKCPQSVYAAWFNNPPYLESNGKKVSGILPEYLKEMIDKLCGACPALKRKQGANVNASTLYWDRTKDGHSPMRPNQKRLKELVGNSVHLHVAILGRSEIHNFQSVYKFVCIVHSPGIAFIVRDPLQELDKTKAIMQSLAQCWPAIIIIILFSMVFGIIMWVLDCKKNQEEFPNKSFLQGLYHGSYWAFVSMTTVGYGDKTPRSFFAQCVAISWMLMGPIINGIVIGAITTSLTTINLEPDPKIYGSKVGAIADSFEYNLGVRRNAKMNETGKVYKRENELVDALKDREVDGILIDSLVAANMAYNLSEKKLKISKIIPEKSGWGIILSAELLKLEDEIRSYEANHADKMKKLVQNRTKGLTVKAAPPAELDSGLVDPNSPTFLNIVQYGTIAIGVCIILALIFEYGYLRFKKNKVVPFSEAHRSLLEGDVANIVLDFCNTVPEKLKSKCDEHESELKRFFWKKGYSFGVDGWLRQKTSNEEKIKKDIRYQEIMNEDLGYYKKESIYKQGKASLYCLKDGSQKMNGIKEEGNANAVV